MNMDKMPLEGKDLNHVAGGLHLREDDVKCPYCEIKLPNSMMRSHIKSVHPDKIEEDEEEEGTKMNIMW